MNPRRTLTMLISTLGVLLGCVGVSFALTGSLPLTGGPDTHRVSHESAAVAQYCPPGQTCTTPVPPPAVKPPAVAHTVSSKGILRVAVTCAKATCRGKIIVTARVRTRVRKGGHTRSVMRRVRLGARRYAVRAGHREVMSVRISARGRRLLRQAGRRGLRATVYVTAKGGRTMHRSVRVKLAPKRHGHSKK